MRASFHRSGAVLTAHISGLVYLDAWDAVLREVAEQSHRGGDRRALLVLTGLVGTLGIPEREQLGRMYAAHLGHLRKLALFIQRERISGVAQRSACAAGLPVRVFADWQEAQAWLGSDPCAPAGLRRAPAAAAPPA